MDVGSSGTFKGSKELNCFSIILNVRLMFLWMWFHEEKEPQDSSALCRLYY